MQFAPAHTMVVRYVNHAAGVSFVWGGKHRRGAFQSPARRRRYKEAFETFLGQLISRRSVSWTLAFGRPTKRGYTSDKIGQKRLLDQQGS